MLDLFRKLSRTVLRTRFRRTRFRVRMLWNRVMGRPLDARLRLLFNFWAENNRGENMERTHLHLAQAAIQKLALESGDRVLDLGCGEGLASRLIAGLTPGSHYRVLGLDIADQMLYRARSKNTTLQNVAFVCASAEHIPCQNGFFTKALSVEAFYYFEHQERVLEELFRVLAHSGCLVLVICHYKDYPESLAFLRKVAVSTHARSATEYKTMLQAGGWEQVEVEELVWEPRPGQPSFHERGLLIRARKPDVSAPRK